MITSLLLILVLIDGSRATCCCSETASVFPRVELTTQQKQALVTIADALERLPCEERMAAIYGMRRSPIQLSDSQIVGLAQRFGGSFQDPSNTTECQDQTIQFPEFGQEQPRPQRRRRGAGTSVCLANVEENMLLYMAYNKQGQLVYIPQPSPGNGFQMAQYFYESICDGDACVGPVCNCSTELLPTSTCVVNVIQGNSNTFTQQTVLTRMCQAFT